MKTKQNPLQIQGEYRYLKSEYITKIVTRKLKEFEKKREQIPQKIQEQAKPQTKEVLTDMINPLGDFDNWSKLQDKENDNVPQLKFEEESKTEKDLSNCDQKDLDPKKVRYVPRVVKKFEDIPTWMKKLWLDDKEMTKRFTTDKTVFTQHNSLLKVILYHEMMGVKNMKSLEEFNNPIPGYLEQHKGGDDGFVAMRMYFPCGASYLLGNVRCRIFWSVWSRKDGDIDKLQYWVPVNYEKDEWDDVFKERDDKSLKNGRFHVRFRTAAELLDIFQNNDYDYYDNYISPSDRPKNVDLWDHIKKHFLHECHEKHNIERYLRNTGFYRPKSKFAVGECVRTCLKPENCYGDWFASYNSENGFNSKKWAYGIVKKVTRDNRNWYVKDYVVEIADESKPTVNRKQYIVPEKRLFVRNPFSDSFSADSASAGD